jgi:DNA-directed RNA polymerase specialized sigma24 family protein
VAPGPKRDPVDEVAAVASAQRALLLNVNRYRLRREDLEDCYSQATLELVAYVRRGGTFANRRHLTSALELRLQSRIQDRRRALGGRSPMQAAIETGVSFDASGEASVDVADSGADVERLVMLRHELALVLRLAMTELSPDQRLALAAQLDQADEAELCRRLGWSREKYRKAAQRGRARLRGLLGREESAVPSRVGASEKSPGTHL